MPRLNFDQLILVKVFTTGLIPMKNEIIEIGAFHLPTCETFHEKILLDKVSEKSMDDIAIDIANYDHDVWEEEGKDSLEVLKSFQKFCSKHANLKHLSKKNKSCYFAACAGFNCLSFDRIFIDRWFKKHELYNPMDVRMYDIQQLVQWLYPNLQSYSLKYLDEYFLKEEEFDEMNGIMDELFTQALILAVVFTKKLPHQNKMLERFYHNSIEG